MEIEYIHKKVIQLMHEIGYSLEFDSSNIHLFNDLFMNSLDFMILLINIEELFGITIEISQMEGCAQLQHLLTLIKEKLGEDYV